MRACYHISLIPSTFSTTGRLIEVSANKGNRALTKNSPNADFHRLLRDYNLPLPSENKESSPAEPKQSFSRTTPKPISPKNPNFPGDTLAYAYIKTRTHAPMSDRYKYCIAPSQQKNEKNSFERVREGNGAIKVRERERKKNSSRSASLIAAWRPTCQRAFHAAPAAGITGGGGGLFKYPLLSMTSINNAAIPMSTLS